MSFTLNEVTTRDDVANSRRRFILTMADKFVTAAEVIDMLPPYASESELFPGKVMIERSVTQESPETWSGVLRYGDWEQAEYKPLCEKVVAAIADSHLAGFRDPLAWAHWCRTLAVEVQAGDIAEVERLIRERR